MKIIRPPALIRLSAETLPNTIGLDLDFTTAGAGGIRDLTGQPTGLTQRLPGTGASLAPDDPNLSLDPTEGVLTIISTRSDYNGQIGLDSNGSVGINLSDLGFTGAEDFAVSATFRPWPTPAFIDQVGIFVGGDAGTLTRAGAIVLSEPQRLSVHTQNGSDHHPRFGQGGIDNASGLAVTILREAGVWRSFINAVEWNPTDGGGKVDPEALNALTDLTAGVFAIHPLNDNPKAFDLDSFSVLVVAGDTTETPLESWRNSHFGTTVNEGSAADDADPDGDGRPNLLEYALGTDPLGAAASSSISLSIDGSPARLAITFDRTPDPFLTYTVKAASALGEVWTPIWSSNGSSNTKGPVTVDDVVDISGETSRFLRLMVRR